ncbi:MAG: tetratricopeptide repeat protein, partial [Stackebrandtia sp.]
LELLAVDGDPRAAVAAVFEGSFAVLDAPTRRFLCALGLLPGADFAEELAAAVGDVDQRRARLLLDRLVGGHLVERHRPGRYRFHDLMRLYVRRRLETALDAPTREAIVERIVDWFAAEWRPDEFDNLIATCRRLSDHPRLWQMVARMKRFINVGHELGMVRQLGQTAMRVAEAGDDAAGVIKMHDLLAVAKSQAGAYGEGIEHARTAVKLAHEIGDGDASGVLRGNLGLGLYQLGEIAEAETLLREALRIAEQTGNVRHLRNRSLTLGAVCRASGKFAEAEQHLLRACELSRAIGEADSGYMDAYSLAKVYVDMGRYAEAEQLANTVLVDARSHSSERYEALALARLGELRRRAGNTAEARSLLEQAIELSHRSRPIVEWDARGELAELFADVGDCERGIRLLEECADDVADLRGPRASMDLNLARLRLLSGDFPAAVAAAENAREHFATGPEPLRLARALQLLAEAHAGLGEAEQARELAQRALEMFVALDVPEVDEASRFLESVRP